MKVGSHLSFQAKLTYQQPNITREKMAKLTESPVAYADFCRNAENPVDLDKEYQIEDAIRYAICLIPRSQIVAKVEDEDGKGIVLTDGPVDSRAREKLDNAGVKYTYDKESREISMDELSPKTYNRLKEQHEELDLMFETGKYASY